METKVNESLVVVNRSESIDAKPQIDDNESDLLELTALGSGQEVGRSCIYLSFKGKKILLDCGIHPGLNGMDGNPGAPGPEGPVGSPGKQVN